MVGQTGRRQAITLASGCWTNGIVAHEIGKFYRLRESFRVPYGASLPSVYFSEEKWLLVAEADFPGRCHF